MTSAIYGKNIPKQILGTNTEDDTFTVRYCNEMIKEDGINWTENSGEREMITGVTFETVKAGVELFHKAVGCIRAHENDRVLVVKETLKQ